jgi:hypothetical protein
MTNTYRNSGNDIAICRVGNVPEHGICGLEVHLSQLNALAIPLI